MKKLSIVAILIASLSSTFFGSSLSLSFSQNATNNLFQIRTPEKDLISIFGFAYDKSFSSLSFFTEGEYYYLYRNTDISYFTQNLGLDYLYAFNEKTALYLAVKINGNLYRSSFSDFNYFSPGLAGALKSYLTPESILKLNYSFDYKKYNYSAFDNYSQLATLTLDRYFQSKTTLKIGINWGYKHFLHPAPGSSEDFGKGYDGARGRQGSYLKREITEVERGLQIFSLSGLTAQGLGDRIGLRFSAERQWTLSGQNPFYNIEEYYLVENPSYDHFTWNGYVLSGLITVEFPLNWQLKLGYTKSEKNFPGIESMNEKGVGLGLWRQDQRSLWEAYLEKNFTSFSIILAYAYASNQSNDFLYNWQSHFLSLSLEWHLNWGSSR